MKLYPVVYNLEIVQNILGTRPAAYPKPFEKYLPWN